MERTGGRVRPLEGVARGVFQLSAAFSILAVAGIVGYLLYAAIPAFRQTGVFAFLFGEVWSPQTGQYGVARMAAGTFCLTACAILLGGTLGVFTAVWLVFYCPKKLRGWYSQLIALLSGIPSIIYGLFGYKFLMPLLVKVFHEDSAGFGLLSSSLILSLMILPTVASITQNSLKAVPMHYFEGSLALGCNKNQSVFQVLLPAAKGGIFSALILGIGRAVGETMAVQMIVGNGSGYPSGAFVPFTTLTSNIVQNWGYAEVWNGDLNAPTQQNALFACGFVLLVIILLLNILLVAVRRQRSGNRFFTRRFEEGNGAGGGVKSYRQTGRLQNGLCVLSWVVAILVAALLATLVVFVLFKGIPHMRLSFLFGRSGNGGITLVPAMTATFMLVVLALFVALPLGIGAAIYLNEYAKKGGRFQKVISLFIDTLAGIPSIIFGIFGYVFFVRALNFGYSLLAGGITLALLVLPTVIRSVWQCLSEVPDSMREASFALGAGKLKTIFCVVMPRALSGILTAVMLSVGRILSESAALIFTVGTAATFVPLGYHEGCASLAVLIWHFMSNGLQTDEAYATAAVLLFLVVAINALIWLLPKFLKGRVSQ